jgi:hypothetical protein
LKFRCQYIDNDRLVIVVFGSGQLNHHFRFCHPVSGSVWKRKHTIDPNRCLDFLYTLLAYKLILQVELVLNLVVCNTRKRSKKGLKPLKPTRERKIWLNRLVPSSWTSPSRAEWGAQTIKELIRIDPDVKAIVCSGYSNDPVMADFQKFGFKGAMAKPYEKKNLIEALEKLLG